MDITLKSDNLGTCLKSVMQSIQWIQSISDGYHAAISANVETVQIKHPVQKIEN
jgi:hypothetical protein